jgi:AAA+ superfamily predicted ATPase
VTLKEEEWQAANERYLCAALSWLRLRLERCAGAVNGQQQSNGRSPGGESVVSALMSWPGFGSAAPSPLPRSAEKPAAQEFEDMEKAASADPPPALVMLSRFLGLSRFEQDILLLCAGMELDTRIPALCARAQGTADRPYPTFALSLALFDEPRWDALSPDRPLRHWRLIEISQHSAEPLTTSPIRADERIVSYIKGLNTLDDRISPLLISCRNSVGLETLPPSQQKIVERIRDFIVKSQGKGRIPIIELTGPDSAGKELVARHVSAAIGRHLFRLPAGTVPSQADELEALARLYERESILLPVALYVEHGENEAQTVPAERFLARSNGIIFLDTRDAAPLHCPSEVVGITRPTPAEQEEAWYASSPMVSSGFAKVLAGQFSMDVTAIRTAAAVAPPGSTPDETEKLIWEACVAATRPRLDLLAQRIEPKPMLDDLVLPEKEKKLLNEIAGQVKNRMTVYDDWGFRQKMNRGLGISALFAGESGTGKTMAAEAIANELSLNLFRIDLSQVVSKYIGETEKNLRRLFDAAEDGGAILFFDEADALFGRRSEVKDSHDRYANIEINYLLQRMEAFQGLAILATNQKSALDPAFVRRLRFIVDFPYPGPAERRAIWENVFPQSVPCDKLDLDRLARFNLTGGNIHSIALNAAFLAAGSGGKVTMKNVLDATKTEFAKMNRPVNEAEFV